jgi:hypothetical protein
VSPILQSCVTALGGILAGLALAGFVLFHQQQALSRWRHQALTDDTTGLPNRRAALDHLRRVRHSPRRYGVARRVPSPAGMAVMRAARRAARLMTRLGGMVAGRCAGPPVRWRHPAS